MRIRIHPDHAATAMTANSSTAPKRLAYCGSAAGKRRGSHRNGRPTAHYRCSRCELNAFSSDGLAAFIEDGLARHGVTAKIVSPPDVLDEHVRSVRDEALTDLVWAELERMVDIAAVKRRLVADHPDLADVDEARIRDTFTDDPTQSWRSSAQQLVQKNLDATEGLADAVRAQLAEQLATPQDHEA
jgi:hypothetical protein